MPWKDVKMETMREEFVKRVLAHEKSKSALCQEYGISRPTGDKWIQRYLAGTNLSDLSRAPKSIPHRTAADMEQKIVEYRKKYPAIGAVKIKRMMEDEGETNLPCARTINDIFKSTLINSRKRAEKAGIYGLFGTFSTLISVHVSEMDSLPEKQVWLPHRSHGLKKKSQMNCGSPISRDISL